MKILLSAAEIQMDPNLKYKYTLAINIFDDMNILFGLENKNTLRPRPKKIKTDQILTKYENLVGW